MCTGFRRASARSVAAILQVGPGHCRRWDGRLLTKLEYKCGWYGAEYLKADQWYPSSKLCSHCGWKHNDLGLGERQWWCGGCGALNERDYNAAVNLSNWPGLSFPVTGRAETV